MSWPMEQGCDDYQGRTADAALSAMTGLPVVHLGNVISVEDVRSLEDDCC